MRSYHGLNRRAVAWSHDGGDTLGGVLLDPQLVEPVCQASVLRHAMPGGETIFLFSNPASRKRERLTVRVSRDLCATWNEGRVLYARSCGYSDLCPVSEGMIGCLYERDRDGAPYGAITFARIPLEWLQGKDEPAGGEGSGK
jgi:sialidase-1